MLIAQSERKADFLAEMAGKSARSFATPQTVCLLAFAVSLAVVSSVLQEWFGGNPEFLLMRYFAIMGVLVPTFLLVAAVVWFFDMAIRVRPEKPFDHARSSLKFLLSPEMLLVRALPVFIYLFLIMSAYSGLKVHIGDFNDYSWDRAFADMDSALFFGTDPWTLVHAAFPGIVWGKIFNIFYHLWFFVMFGIWFWVAGMPGNDRSRVGFLFASGFCWAIGGIVIATAFASVGPCYYERLLGDPRFSGLMHTLRGYDLMAIAVQDEWWDLFVTKSNGVGAGLSAFPSMHCTYATLFALFGFSRDRKLGWVLTIFAAFIYLGSVYLGWHYATDAIGGIVIGVCSWWFGLYLADKISEGRLGQERASTAAGPM
jgi:membrane-associated phospholipid phosphatase